MDLTDIVLKRAIVGLMASAIAAQPAFAEPEVTPSSRVEHNVVERSGGVVSKAKPIRQLVRAMPGMVLGGSFSDECTTLKGYGVFRSRLTAAVAARDEASFRALFGKDGYMRMDGVGGGAQMPPTGSNPVTSRIWNDLDQILSLGCAVENGKLLLPFTAQAPENLSALGQMVAVRSTSVRSAPNDKARTVIIAPRGALLVQLKQPPRSVDGWEYFTLSNGRSGYVRARDLRSPTASALQVAREGNEWRIIYYGGYD